MGYHPRIETTKFPSFLTSRSRNSELWFINNKALQQAILGYLAKYRERHGVKLYGFAIEGNHIQGPALFPGLNRSDFMRDLKSTIARAVDRLTPEYPGGIFWGRRYSNEFTPGNDDLEAYFFYTVLQPVQDGLVEKISQYPGYNCFHDAAWGIKRKFKVVNWGAYNDARRYKKNVAIADYTEEFELVYERLPGYEHLTQAEYAKMLNEKLEKYRQAIVADRYAKGLGFAGTEALRKTPRGARPKNTKTSTINDRRPRILALCPERWREGMKWYFDLYFR